MAAAWLPPAITLKLGTFSDLDSLCGEPLDGVVLDLGVSSMQLDQPERGFSFMKDGPLDMRMSQDGPSAADLVATLSETELADILYHYGEEHASRRIARAIVDARTKEPITTTLRLAEIVARQLPRPKPGQSHPATRSFQALRIAVNAEFDQLAEGLAAAERALRPGGKLAVVTFHSLEDRIVKRFFQLASGHEPAANRYAPATTQATARFTLATRKAIGPSPEEEAANPRSRSAKLRVGIRTDAPPKPLSPADLACQPLPAKDAAKMRPVLYVLTFLGLIALGFWAYRENYATQTAIREVRALQGEIANLREALSSSAPNGPISTAPTGCAN